MINIGLRASRFPDRKSLSEVRVSLGDSVQIVKGGGFPYIETSHINYNIHLGIWFISDIDLEDMVQIVEGAPELEAAWVREAFDRLKYDAGLNPQGTCLSWTVKCAAMKTDGNAGYIGCRARIRIKIDTARKCGYNTRTLTEKPSREPF
jgi:hypothetical protein